MRWTRRDFMEAGAGAALLTSIQPAAGAVFTPEERATLRTAMDEIIPAAEGMPAASEAGGLDYIERVVPQLQGLADLIRDGLAKLGGKFANLPAAERVETLKTMERETAPEFFRALRDLTYEAYYTRPEVWRRIGYESHLTDHQGPQMKPFDEAALAKVRQRGKLYREVS